MSKKMKYMIKKILKVIKNILFSFICIIVFIAILGFYAKVSHIIESIFLVVLLLFVIVYFLYLKNKNINLEKIWLGILTYLIFALGTSHFYLTPQYLRYNFDKIINNTDYNTKFHTIISFGGDKVIEGTASFLNGRETLQMAQDSAFPNGILYDLNFDGDSCEIIRDEIEMSYSPCSIVFFTENSASLYLEIINYMGNIEYNINNSDWKKLKLYKYGDEYNPFGKEYISSFFAIRFTKEDLVANQVNSFKIKFGDNIEEIKVKYKKY